MNKIMKLSKQTANKIAAGEVIDRPVSVIKELIENSIDAEATNITVEIKNGGKSYMRITDNGIGISPGDIDIAFERHATSKIIDVSDLDSIDTLGFRGEALASISSVSNTELITKTRDNKFGVQAFLNGGIIENKKEIGCPDGTTLIISNLFYNIPARLKFLKQDHIEGNIIIDIVSKLALAYPNVKFRMINNGKILFSTSGKGDIYNNILGIYKKEIFEGLVHIKEDNKNVKINAYISPTAINMSTKKYQIYFVNGRYVKSSMVDKAINKAYAELLDSTRYPITFIFLDIPSEEIDVNVHPNKKEIKFYYSAIVESALENLIRSTLLGQNAIPEIKQSKIFVNKENIEKNEKKEQVDITALQSTFRPDLERIYEIPSITKNPTIHESVETFKSPSFVAIEEPVKSPVLKHVPFDILSLNILGSTFSTYIIASDFKNMYLIDQHAAHERIMYEQLLSEHKNNIPATQGLLAPYVIETRANEFSLISLNLEFINQLGYEIEEFGSASFIVKGVPADIEFSTAQQLLKDIIENLDNKNDYKDYPTIKRIIGNSCKSAIKGNEKLNIKEMESLLKVLSKADNPFSCPHGRPVFIKLSQKDIEKMFKRI